MDKLYYKKFLVIKNFQQFDSKQVPSKLIDFMRKWILYNTEIGTHTLKKGYEPMLTMVTKGSMIMPEGDSIGDCSLVI
jgi:hypothetical protein